jgi:hypothetical protein
MTFDEMAAALVVTTLFFLWMCSDTMRVLFSNAQSMVTKRLMAQCQWGPETKQQEAQQQPSKKTSSIVISHTTTISLIPSHHVWVFLFFRFHFPIFPLIRYRLRTTPVVA